MELGKNSNSDASSQESSNNQTSEIRSSGDGVVRSYECTFCKRGFTNAQALGGHMNIHRKDKAKAKHKINQEEASLNKSNLRYVSQVSSHDNNHLRVVGGERNYQVYLPSSNPNFQTGNYLPLWRPDLFEGRAVENSSLRVGISQPKDEHEGGGIIKGNDVDLELRLGHQP